MKSVVLIIFLSLTFVSFSQTKFSVSPLISYKLHTNGYPVDFVYGFNVETTNLYQQNPYYHFDVKRLSERPAIDIGIRVQASFDDNKHLLSLEWSTDASGTMCKESSMTTDLNKVKYTESNIPYNRYGSYTRYVQTGFAFSRFSLQYGRRLTNKLPVIRPYIISDVSLGFNFSNTFSYHWERDTTYSNVVYYHNHAKRLYNEVVTYAPGGLFFLMGLGLRGDLMLPLKKKNIYLFTLETTFRQGFKIIEWAVYRSIIDDGGTIIEFGNPIASRGSGIYFQISRNIQIHPWKKKNKEK